MYQGNDLKLHDSRTKLDIRTKAYYVHYCGCK